LQRSLFTITGITLNHANSIGAQPVVTSGTAKLPQDLLAELTKQADAVEPDAALFIDWAEEAFDLSLRGATAEWSDEELYLSAPGPGRDAWVSIDRAGGAAKYETTDRGWVAYFNDLHKGRNTASAGRSSSTSLPLPCCFSADGPGAFVDPGRAADVHLATGRRRYRHRGYPHDPFRALNS
jgi:hypothetical protein